MVKQGREGWFTPGSVLGTLGLEDDNAGRRAYAERMRSRAVKELADLPQSPTRMEMRRGWCLGGPAFRERMLALLDAAGEKLSRDLEMDGAVRRSHGEDEAARLLAAGLAVLGLDQQKLQELAKGDERKMALAAFIRERTIVPNQWLAQALCLGHVSRASRCWRGDGKTAMWKKKLLEALGP